MRKESIFDKIDNYFGAKSDSEASTVMGVVALAIGGLLMFAFFSDTKEYKENQESRLQTAITNLNSAQSRLNTQSGGTQDHEFTVKQKNNELRKEENKLADLRNINAHLDAKLRDSASVTFNQERWAAFLDNLSKNAETDNVKIYSIESEQKSIQGNEPQEVLKVTMDIEGKFNNVLKYINDIEESVVVVDVNGLDINATKDSKVGGKLKISVWGMEYR
jgi:hypothetical protein